MFAMGIELKQSKKAMRRYSSKLYAAEEALEDFKEKTKEGADLKEQVRVAEEKVKLAEIEIQTANQNLANARAKAQADNQAAEDRLYEEEEKAREESIKATWEAVSAEKERNDKMRDEARMEKKLKESIEKAKTLEDELTRATKELKDAELDYANKLKNAQVASANATWQGWAGNNGIPASQIIGNGMNGQSRYGARNNVSKHDAGYNQRVQEGYERNAQSQGYGLSARDKARQRELEAKHDRAMERGQKLSDKDAAELAELESRDPSKQKAKAEKEAADAAKELEAAKERKDQAEQQMWSNV